MGVLAETKLAWEKKNRNPSLNAWTHWCKGNDKEDKLAKKGASTPLVGLEPFGSLGDVFFKKDYKRLNATRRDRPLRKTERLC